MAVVNHRTPKIIIAPRDPALRPAGVQAMDSFARYHRASQKVRKPRVVSTGASSTPTQHNHEAPHSLGQRGADFRLSLQPNVVGDIGDISTKNWDPP